MLPTVASSSQLVAGSGRQHVGGSVLAAARHVAARGVGRAPRGLGEREEWLLGSAAGSVTGERWGCYFGPYMCEGVDRCTVIPQRSLPYKPSPRALTVRARRSCARVGWHSHDLQLHVLSRYDSHPLPYPNPTLTLTHRHARTARYRSLRLPPLQNI